MSLPPQVIGIKRRRDEDPVDTLYIEQESSPRPRQRRVTHAGFTFRRHVGFQPASEAFKSISPQVTQPKSTLPVTNPTIRAPSSTSAPTTAQPLSPPPAPRKFYLSTTDKLLAPSLGPIHQAPLKNPRSKQTGDVAVFVERSPAARTVSDNSPAAPDSIYEQMLEHALGPGYRARGAPSDPLPEDSSGVKDSVGGAGDADGAMDTSSDDFVYDTYVRVPDPVAGEDAVDGVVAAPDTGAIGFVVITERDEVLWQSYADDGGVDEVDPVDWDSEADDENAENYYGADYPEDEVASDDELGGGAYGYRRGASDDEEYGPDYGEAWSDDGEIDLYPWREKGIA